MNPIGMVPNRTLTYTSTRRSDTRIGTIRISIIGTSIEQRGPCAAHDRRSESNVDPHPSMFIVDLARPFRSIVMPDVRARVVKSLQRQNTNDTNHAAFAGGRFRAS